MSESAFSIYLNDHIAEIVGEIELAKRVEHENRNSALSEFLCELVAELARQKNRLEDRLNACGARPSKLKQIAAWAVEKAGRVKPNDALTSYTDLARVLEIEALRAAAETRVLLWETLDRIDRAHAPEPDGWAAERDATRKTADALSEFHRRAVEKAFSAAPCKDVFG